MTTDNQPVDVRLHWTNAVFVTWDPNCTRSRNQCRHLGADMLIVAPVKTLRTFLGTFVRYAISMPLTIVSLWRRHADVVFTQNQPIFLVLAVAIYARLRRVPYIIDSHSGAFNDPKWKWSLPIYRVLARRALVNLNTNEHHQNIVEAWGGKSILVPDVPIFIDAIETLEDTASPYVAVVTSFSFDEPIAEIFEAARRVPDMRFYMTGNHAKLPRKLVQSKPDNVHFTGYVSYPKYLGLLRDAMAVLVLTTRDHTMQRGAYEALALTTPIITSDFQVLRDCFGDAGLYVDNDPISIAKAVQDIRQQEPLFRSAAKKQKSFRKAYYSQAIDQISELAITGTK